MSFGSSLIHAAGNVATPLLEGYGALTNQQQFVDAGKAISNPNIVATNISAANPFVKGSVFSSVTPAPTTSRPQSTVQDTAPDPYNPAPYRAASGGSYTTKAAADAADASYYNGLEAQTNGQIGNLDQQQNVGLGNINSSYNNSLNSLLGDQAIAQRNYDTSKTQGLQDYTTSRGQNQFQTGQQANSLQRLLGAHGYSGSANQAAGYAAALQGTQQAQGLDSTYGRNMQALDTNFGDYQGKVKGQRDNLDQQKYQQENSLKASVQTNRQTLLNQLASIAQARTGKLSAGANFTNQANALDSQITALGNQYANPVMQVTPPTYQAPSLDSYTVNPQAAAQVAQPGAAGNINPYFQALLGGDKKKGLGLGV